PLTISFTHLLQVSNPDSDGSDGDYYARVKIGNNPEHVTARIEDDDFNPAAVDSSWTITDQVDPDQGPGDITVQLWDYDGFLNGNDDPLDIDPDPSASYALLKVDPITGTWTGSVTSPNNVLEGDGAGGFYRSHLEFTISTPFTNISGPDSDGDGLLDSWETNG